MHLDAAQIERYTNGQADHAEAAAHAAHVSLCLHCAQRVAKSAQPERWERKGPLRRLVRAA
jgi:anti-sigma factor ChrR (cupin superfamily)